MKIRLLILVMLLALSSLRSFSTWTPFGPEGIAANKICFLTDNANHWAICHDEGLYLYDHMTQSWTNYPSSIPVLDACYLDSDMIMVILGCGSNSDGIYALNPVNGEYVLIEFLDCPNFIIYDDIIQQYYIGHHIGLETSADGLSWTQVGIFNYMNIVAMDIYQNHYVVSRVDNLYAIWHSDDHGSTWVQSPAGSPMISCLGFDSYQKLYGIFPDESWSSGLWSSLDYGHTWEVEFWSINMNCVGFDALGSVFTGWGDNSGGMEEGIAHYDPLNGTLSFMNEGLSNLVINDICLNPVLSAIVLFCCTENGAYVSDDYVRVSEYPDLSGPAHLKIFPNPASHTVSIEYQLTDNDRQATLRIFQTDGRSVMTTDLGQQKGRVKLNISDYTPGIYHVILSGPGNISSQKLSVE
jgi:hypothetical protein